MSCSSGIGRTGRGLGEGSFDPVRKRLALAAALRGRACGLATGEEPGTRRRDGIPFLTPDVAPAVEAIALIVAGLAGRELLRLADRLFDSTVDWALRHRRRDPHDDPVAIAIYGPDGEVQKQVLVHQDDGDA